MDSLIVPVLAFTLAVIGATVGSTRQIQEGNEALVERLGRYHRKLTPGLNFGIVPLIDRVVVEASTKEKVLDIDPIEATTKDNVTIKVDAVLYWRIFELQQAWYEVEKVEKALEELVSTTLRSEMGRIDLNDTFSSRIEINRNILKSLDEATESWGVKVIRVEVQNLEMPPNVRTALETERAAKSERQAEITRAQGRREAQVENAMAIAESVKSISKALPDGINTQEIMRYLVAQRYVDANLEIGKSPSSKVLFLSPRDFDEATAELISGDDGGGNQGGDGSNGANSAGNGSGRSLTDGSNQ